MINQYLSQIQRIFVGREKEFQDLNARWEIACKGNEHPVSILLNTPGIGKSCFLREWGRKIEGQKKALTIFYRCNNKLSSSIGILKSLLLTIKINLTDKIGFILDYIEKTHISFQSKEQIRDDILDFIQIINKSIKEETINEEKFLEIIIQLSQIIPIIIIADEIQELQLVSIDNTNESALHYFASLIASILDQKILFILSGTRYHILSQIGEKVASPLRGKIDPFILTHLSKEDISNYCYAIHQLIDELIPSSKNNEMNYRSILINHFKEFLLFFSGGHGRTIEKIALTFLNQYPKLLEIATQKNGIVYQDFVEVLFPNCKIILNDTLLPQYVSDEIKHLQSQTAFSVIKDWIVNQGAGGLFLGQIPYDEKTDNSLQNIKDMVYNLVNIGILLQNGQNNYYLTSYFHFMAFISILQQDYPIFLSEILNNRFFWMFCGNEQGFGYTFERIIAASILIQTHSSPIQLGPKSHLIKSVVYHKGKSVEDIVDIDENVLYHSPHAVGVDFILLQDGILWVIELTTAQNPEKSKIEKLENNRQKFMARTWIQKNIKSYHGWFISLFEFEIDRTKYPEILFSLGQDLVLWLSEPLFKKLLEVKAQLKFPIE